MEQTPAMRILSAWVELEAALRNALPDCSVAPPTQPAEVLAALLINRRIGAAEEGRIRTLREVRNRVAAVPEEPLAEEAERYEKEAAALAALIQSPPPVA
jgi:hypothetical protein